MGLPQWSSTFFTTQFIPVNVTWRSPSARFTTTRAQVLLSHSSLFIGCVHFVLCAGMVLVTVPDDNPFEQLVKSIIDLDEDK